MQNKRLEELKSKAQTDFEKNFGVFTTTQVTIETLGNEECIVVSNHLRKAFYSMNIDILKVINLSE